MSPELPSGMGTPEQVLSARLAKGHHVLKLNPGLKAEVQAVQGSKAASMGAEDAWYNYYRLRGAPLLNDPKTPPLSNKPSKLPATQERVDAYNEDL